MLWVTRHTIRVNRTATAWLVRRFIDPGADFCFAEPAEVARIQRDHGAIGFDAPGARYPHQDAFGRCSFEALAAEYMPSDRALRVLARIVHAADFPAQMARARNRSSSLTQGFDCISLSSPPANGFGNDRTSPEAAGLRLISQGFPLVTCGDKETLQRSTFLYDALYASIQASFTPPTPAWSPL